METFTTEDTEATEVFTEVCFNNRLSCSLFHKKSSVSSSVSFVASVVKV